jgi:chorismate mutase
MILSPHKTGVPMSIEKKIEDLIASIDKNTAALIALVGTPIATAKPVAAAPKVVKLAKPAKSEEEVVQEFVAKAAAKAAAEDAAEVQAVEGTATAARVESVIGDMLKANKRKEAIGLLASFNGAKSKTGIIEQGADVMAAFVEQAEAILLGS